MKEAAGPGPRASAGVDKAVQRASSGVGSLGARRRDVFFVIPAHATLLDIAGPADALRLASTFGACAPEAAVRAEPEPEPSGDLRFDLHYIGPASVAPTSIGLPFSGIAPLPETLPADAIVVIVGVTPPADAIGRQEAEQAVAATVDWLARAVAGGEQAGLRVLCVCSGALIAARAGLLDARHCTTHHTLLNELATLAPRAKVLENRLYVRDGCVCTSAGITAGIDMTLQMIAELAGPRTASLVAREMVVYMRRAGGDPQLSPWVEGRNHLHPAVHRVQDAIAGDPTRDWSVNAMAGIACTSARNLTRVFGRSTGMQPLDYVHRLRIALARELIVHSTFDMETIAARTGFGSARHMRRVWRKYDAKPPSSIRAQAATSATDSANGGRGGSGRA